MVPPPTDLRRALTDIPTEPHQGLGFRAQGLGSKVKGSGFKVYGLGGFRS